MWQELYHTAPLLGLQTDTRAQNEPVSFAPEIYQRVYEALLRHRHCQVMPMDVMLATSNFSPYRFVIEKSDVIPSPEEVAACIGEAEQHYPDVETLQRVIDHWYLV
ncbi:MAG: hypothetical protein V3U27_15400 [Candidatus Tectomicrobia bacterium]